MLQDTSPKSRILRPLNVTSEAEAQLRLPLQAHFKSASIGTTLLLRILTISKPTLINSCYHRVPVLSSPQHMNKRKSIRYGKMSSPGLSSSGMMYSQRTTRDVGPVVSTTCCSTRRAWSS